MSNEHVPLGCSHCGQPIQNLRVCLDRYSLTILRADGAPARLSVPESLEVIRILADHVRNEMARWSEDVRRFQDHTDDDRMSILRMAISDSAPAALAALDAIAHARLRSIDPVAAATAADADIAARLAEARATQCP